MTETPDPMPAEVRAVVVAEELVKLAELHRKRQVYAMGRAGYTVPQIARWLHSSQDGVNKMLAEANQTAEWFSEVFFPREGFSGATPEEICQRYAVGQIDRARLVDELVRYPYLPRGKTDGYDSLIVNPPGTWAEVESATGRGLIDDAIYDEVLDQRHPRDR